MGKTLSKKNKYYVEKNRFYELKYFCRQYPIWKEALKSLSSLTTANLELFGSKDGISPVERCAMARESYLAKIKVVEQAAESTDPTLSKWVIIGVTTGASFIELQNRYNIPCCIDTYYDRYRKFFYILSRAYN